MKNYKKIALKVLVLTFWVSAGIGSMALFSSALAEQKRVRISKVNIDIDQTNGIFFLNEQDIRDIISRVEDGGIVGKQMAGINFSTLEKAIAANPFVDKVDIYTSIRGEVTVSLALREPVVRVINNNRVSYYIDKNGVKMPVSTKFTARVFIVHGNIAPDTKKSYTESDSTLGASIYRLAKFIDGNEFWKAQVEQVSVDELSDFEIVPVLGDQTILIGKADELEQKFKRAMIFYKEVLKNVDAGQYRAIDVRYKEQIICIKKNSTYGTI